MCDPLTCSNATLLMAWSVMFFWSHDPLTVSGRCQNVKGAWAGECPGGSVQSLLGVAAGDWWPG
jgi:hypothetical protein